jgi:hypothetical protein
VPSLVGQEIPDRLLQIRAETPFVRIRSHEQAAGQDDRLEEALGQILRIGGIARDRRNEGSDGRVIPLGEFVQRRGRLGAVAGSFREQVPGCEGELLADWRTLLLPVFRGQRT